MTLDIPASELKPLIEAIVSEVVDQLGSAGSLGANGQLAMLEPAAAEALGVKSSVLRDARLRGEIASTKVGGRIAYELEELQAYLRRNREDMN